MTSSSSDPSDQIASLIPQELPPQHPKLRLATSVLRRAVQFFVRSQLTSVQRLEVDLMAGDRQLLSGSIPGVSLFAQKAVYQGLHLSQIQVEGQHIQVNLGQVMRGKALRLLDDIFVYVNLTVEEADLNASLNSPLLDDLLCRLVQSLAAYLPEASALSTLSRSDIETAQVRFRDDELALDLSVAKASLPVQAIRSRARFALRTPRVLALHHVELELGSPADVERSPVVIPELQVPLGTDVEIEALTIQQGSLRCQGKIRVRP